MQQIQTIRSNSSLNRWHAYKYASIVTLPLTMVLALLFKGSWSFLPIGYVFGLIPLVELWIKPDESNLEEAEEAIAKEDPIYDWLLYFTIALLYGILIWFLVVVSNDPLQRFEYIGLTISMGILCGSMGINIGHELGHRSSQSERVLARIALLSSLYMHFYIEHNRGHHKHVATPEDPASARRGEMILFFWIRTIVFSFISAWQLERVRLSKRKKAVWSLHNEMIQYLLIQAGFLSAILLVFDLQTTLIYICAAFVGILLLETVNYIEHYGLVRRKNERGSYEKTLPHHSWNSNHVIGRILLFELSRHSDHHYQASRKYQVLRHHEASPQMPTGYPGMMLLALVPPLWFFVMHRQLDRLPERG